MTRRVERDFLKTFSISIRSQIARIDNTVKNSTRAINIAEAPFLIVIFMADVLVNINIKVQKYLN